MKFIILFIVIHIGTTTNAQLKLTDSLIVKKRGVYQYDKKLKPKQLKSILLSTPESAVHLKKSKNSIIIATSSVSLAMVFALLAVRKQDDFFYRREKKNQILVFAITSTLLNINMAYFMVKSFKHDKQSVKAYNKTKSIL